MTPPLLITLHSQPRLRGKSSPWVPGRGLANLSPPAPSPDCGLQALGSGSDQGLPLPPFLSSSLPTPPAQWNSPGALRGREGMAWLPEGVVAHGGAPRQGGPSPPPPHPHLVSPLDQTRNKENVWNLSCLLFLLPAGQGPSPRGQDVAQPASLAGENGFLSGAWGRPVLGGCSRPSSGHRQEAKPRALHTKKESTP